MQYIELIILAAVLQFLFFGAMVGKARIASGIKAPSVSGNEIFERAYRVQMNTLELLVAFLPALFIAGKYWSNELISSVGVIYIIGRFIYWRAYMTLPKQRGLGFMLSLIPVIALIVLATVGLVLSLTVTTTT